MGKRTVGTARRRGTLRGAIDAGRARARRSGLAFRVRSRARGRRGFSLLELTLVMSVLLVAFLAMSQSVVGSMKLTSTNRETALATDGVRERMEILQGVEDFDQLFALYNASPADDPDGPGTAPGRGFAIDGLEPTDGDADGMVGEVVFPVIGGELREDLVEPALGMPRDLSGDGIVDALEHSTDYRLLPVLLRVRWKGPDGEREVEARTLIADR